MAIETDPQGNYWNSPNPDPTTFHRKQHRQLLQAERDQARDRAEELERELERLDEKEAR